MNPRLQSALLRSLQLGLATVMMACSEGDHPDVDAGALDAGTDEPPAAPTSTLRLFYSPMYSAFVEGHPAELRVRLDRIHAPVVGAHFRSADPSIAEVVQDGEGAMITVKKEGKVSIEVTMEGKTGSGVLTITKYSEAEWALGEARYKRSERALVAPDGGRPHFFDGYFASYLNSHLCFERGNGAWKISAVAMRLD